MPLHCGMPVPTFLTNLLNLAHSKAAGSQFFPQAEESSCHLPTFLHWSWGATPTSPNLGTWASAHRNLGSSSLSSLLGGQQLRKFVQSGHRYLLALFPPRAQSVEQRRGPVPVFSAESPPEKGRQCREQGLRGKGARIWQTEPLGRAFWGCGVPASARSLPPAAPSGAGRRRGSAVAANKGRRLWQLLL